MNRVQTLYRSTLVAAALATASVGATTAAEAHEQGWRGRGERAWQPAPPPRGYRSGYRHGHAYGAGGWRSAEARECEAPLVARAYYPPPRPRVPGIVLELPSPW